MSSLDNTGRGKGLCCCAPRKEEDPRIHPMAWPAEGEGGTLPPPPSSLLCCMACLLPPPSPPAAAAWNQVTPGEGFDKECLLLSLMKKMHQTLLRWANFSLAILAGGTGREGRLFSRPRSGAQAWRRRKRREMEVCVLCSRGKGPPPPLSFLTFQVFCHKLRKREGGAPTRLLATSILPPRA